MRELTHTFDYNNIDSLYRIFKQYPNQIACVIMEPMNREFPQDGFLFKVQDLCKKNGALFILDETITGFRFANGGASELFGITPDLATFGKGIANGFPLSAIAGKADIMKMMERVHFSFTYSGEIYSLFAAWATLNKLKTGVLETIKLAGEDIQDAFVNRLTGHPSWLHQEFSSMAQKTLYIQEMIKNGVLSIGTLNMQLMHSPEVVVQILNALDKTYEVMKIAEGKEAEYLECEPLVEGFKVR